MKAQIDLAQLKSLQLEILLRMHEICTENGWRYSLGGGTLLGAVRHKGYIPWDDDIDVMMPRPDYDAFIDYCLKESLPFKVKCFDTDKNYTDFSAKLYNPNTVLEDNDTLSKKEVLGVNIDVFVIDGLGKTYKAARKAFRATSFRRNLLIAAQWRKFRRSKTHAWYYEPFRFFFYILGKFTNREKTFLKILKKYRSIEFDKAEYVAPIGGAYREKEIKKREVFTEYITLPFEGYELKAISHYDEYLTKNYGNYMQLPPEEKQVTHHTFKAYFKE